MKKKLTRDLVCLLHGLFTGCLRRRGKRIRTGRKCGNKSRSDCRHGSNHVPLDLYRG